METKPFVFTQPPPLSAWIDEDIERRRLRERDRGKYRGTSKVQKKAKREKWSEEDSEDSLRRRMIKREKFKDSSDHFSSRTYHVENHPNLNLCY